MRGKFFRYLQGYIRIRISGQTVERFINACSHKGIKLWNLSSHATHYEMNITIKDFKRLKPVIRKTRTKVMIVERTGFPFFLKQYKRRYFFVSGFFLCVFLIYLCSNYIWNIEIKGNHSYSTENLMHYLTSIDIERGMRISDIDCSEISRKIRQTYDDIIWVSTSVNGSELLIRVKENEDSKEIFTSTNSNEPYDIISEDTFEITRLIIRNGIVNVKKGDTVKAGDLLVSGQIPVYNDAKEITNYQYCISDADIYGKKTIIYEDQINYQTFEKDYYDIKKTEYFCIIGDCRLQFGNLMNTYNHFQEYSKQKKLGPFVYGIREVIPYEKREKKYTFLEIQQILTANFQYYCEELEKKGVVILKNNVKIYTWSDKAKATGELTIERPIGHKVKSKLLETGDYIDGNDGNNN